MSRITKPLSDVDSTDADEPLEESPMLTLEALQAAGRAARFERFLRGEPSPDASRVRPRTEEKAELLIQSVLDAYKRTPPYYVERDGKRMLVLPWVLAK